MPTKAKKPQTTGTRPKRELLAKLTEAQREDLLTWRDESPRPSFGDCAQRAAEKFKQPVAAWEVSQYYDRHKLLRDLLHVVSVASPASLSAEQRNLIDEAFRNRVKLRLESLLSAEDLDTKKAAQFSILGSTLASFTRNDLAREAHELDKAKHETQRQALALSTREQDRKDAALKLACAQFESEKQKNSKTREALDRLEGKGGVTPEAKTELINTLSGVSN